MQAFAALILRSEQSVEMLGEHRAQTQHSLAFELYRSAAAKRHDAKDTGIDRRKFTRQLPDVRRHLRFAEPRQRVIQRDMRSQVIAPRAPSQ